MLLLIIAKIGDPSANSELESNLIESIEQKQKALFNVRGEARELDKRLADSKFLAGKNYTIADIATFPWIARHDWHDIGLKKYINLSRWYEEISKREAVIKGYDLLKKGEEIPKI